MSGSDSVNLAADAERKSAEGAAQALAAATLFALAASHLGDISMYVTDFSEAAATSEPTGDDDETYAPPVAWGKEPSELVCRCLAIDVDSVPRVWEKVHQTRDADQVEVMASSLACFMGSAPEQLNCTVSQTDANYQRACADFMWRMLLAVTRREEFLDDHASCTSAQECAPFMYDARARASLRLVSGWCRVPWRCVLNLEASLAHLEMLKELPAESDLATESQASEGLESESPSRSKRGFRTKLRDLGRQASKSLELKKADWTWKRAATVGSAAVGGGVLLAVTGGLAAPALAGGITAAGTGMSTVVGGSAAVAAATGALAGVATNAALVGSAFGMAGAATMASKTARVTAGLSVFEVQPLWLASQNYSDAIADSVAKPSSLALTICVSGFLSSDAGEADFSVPWAFLTESADDAEIDPGDEIAAGDVFAMRWEPKELGALGSGLSNLAAVTAAQVGLGEVIKRTVFASVAAAVALPATLLQAANAIDNRWTVGMQRADKAGVALAEWLLARPMGARPVTLIAISLGGRAVFKALQFLARKPNGEGFGIVERAVIMGAPVAPSSSQWQTAAAACAHELVNVYSQNDFTLSVCFRAVSPQQVTRQVAGLAPVSLSVASTRIRSVDVSDITAGSHMAYQGLGKTRECLRRCNLS